MIKKFNEYSINEKNNLLMLIPLIINLGLASPSEAKSLSNDDIEEIVKENPELKKAIDNKEIIKDSLLTINNDIKRLEGIRSAYVLMDEFVDLSKDELMDKFNTLDNIIGKDIITDIVNNSKAYVFDVKNVGVFYKLDINVGGKTTLSYTEDPFSRHIGISRKF